MSNKINRIMKVAYKATFKSAHDQPMAAVLVKGNRILSVGINQTEKTHPEQKERVGRTGRIVSSKKIHAELDALIGADYANIRGSTIYVVRRKKNMDFGLARPCASCEALLKSYGIKKVVYSINAPLISNNQYEQEKM